MENRFKSGFHRLVDFSNTVEPILMILKALGEIVNPSWRLCGNYDVISTTCDVKIFWRQ